jgi:predicted secreted hydrolase
VPPPGAASSELVRVSREDVRLEVLDTWKSPRSKGEYPSRWRLRVEKLGLDATVTPRLADQELPVSVLYWEGSVGVEGTREGKPLTGRGYVELTGYADSQEPRRPETRTRGAPEAEAAASSPVK